MKKSILVIVVALIAFGMIACTAKVNGAFEGANGKWSVQLSEMFGKGEVQTVEGTMTTSFKTEEGMDLKIIEVTNPGYVADEKRLEEETTAVDELQPTRVEVLDIENFGKVYGAVIKDTQMGSEMFYYMTNVGQDVIYFMFVVPENKLTQEREKEIKAVVMSLTLK